MGSFFAEQTQVVDLGDGNSVTLRKLTYGEIGDLIAACRTREGEIDGVRYSRGLVEKGLVSWSGPGFAGREISPENIYALSQGVGRALATAASELNRELDDAEGNASGAATNSASSTESVAAPNTSATRTKRP